MTGLVKGDVLPLPNYFLTLLRHYVFYGALCSSQALAAIDIRPTLAVSAMAAVAQAGYRFDRSYQSGDRRRSTMR